MPKKRPSLRAGLPAFLFAAGYASAMPSFDVSTFTNGMDGWEPDNPWTTSDVDGLTAGDDYLFINPNGIGGRGSRMITFNPTTDWTGDYFGAGVTGIQMDVVNRPGSDPLDLRIVIGNAANPQQSGGTWWISQSATRIIEGSGWNRYFFSLEEGDLQIVGDLTGGVGTDSYAATFGDVQNIRILSSVLGQSAIGDFFVGEVGIDNISLVPEPRQFAVFAGLAVAALAGLRRRC